MEYKYFVIVISNMIHKSLSDKGLSVYQLSELLGRSDREIVKWLTGEKTDFKFKTIVQLETILDIKIINI